MRGLRVFADEAGWIGAVLDEFDAVVRASLGEDRGIELLLGGGSTPEPLYRALAALPLRGPRVRIWLEDERAVPPESGDRNGRLLDRCFSPCAWDPVPELRLWPEGEATSAVARFAAELEASLGNPPSFDLALLGVGGDGHTAGLFPGDPPSEEAFAVRSWGGPLALATFAPAEPRVRMSLSPAALAGARRLLFLTRGPAKAAVLERLSGASGDSLVVKRLADLALASGHSVEYLHCEVG